MKTGKKSIFDPRKAHILAQLDIIVLYTILFEVLKKYWVLAQNPKGLAFGSTDKRLFMAKMV
jgi:hypothetical protein